MSESSAVFILSHGRPDGVITARTLKNGGYTGRVYIVCDDEDPTLPAYQRRYGEQVLVFNKEEVASHVDVGDNFAGRRSDVFARYAIFVLARQLGVRFFVQLDDDYGSFYYRFKGDGKYGHTRVDNFDWLFARIFSFMATTPITCVALAQGGDFIGGASAKKTIGSKRKVMNTFFCDIERPFEFVGRLNDDVNTFTEAQRRGAAVFLTLLIAEVNQMPTQGQRGGMTEAYLDFGTYVKSFYSVMYAPSCVKVSVLRGGNGAGRGNHPRLHHAVTWDACAPCIVSSRHRKTRRSG